MITRRKRRAQTSVAAGLLLAAIAAVVVVDSAKVAKDNDNEFGFPVPEFVSPVGSFAVDVDGAVIPWQQADESKIRVETVLDLHCPACSAVDGAISESVENARKTDAQVWYTPVSFLDNHSSDDYSARAGSALVTVAESDPESFTEFMTLLLRDQPPSGEKYTATSSKEIAKIASVAGVSDEAVKRIPKNRYVEWVRENTEVQAHRNDLFPSGAISTPTIAIGGVMEDRVLTGFNLVKFENDDFKTAFEAEYKNASIK